MAGTTKNDWEAGDGGDGISKWTAGAREVETSTHPSAAVKAWERCALG